jgi:hypothetical protein
VNETYQIPDLASGYGALKPHTSGRLMELHQSLHHAGYVTDANQALERLAAAPCGRWSTGPTSPRGSLSSGVSMRDDRRRDLDHG